MKLLIALAVTTASFSSMAIAETARDLDSHEHGSATLNIAVATDSVLLELNTPWDNLVGFEHEPGNDEQQALVDNALATLNQPHQLFTLTGGDCTFAEVLVESAMPHDDHDGDGHEDDEHDDDGHDDDDDGHDDDKHDDDDEHHDDDEHDDDHDDHEGESSHSSALLTYSYHCNEGEKLTSIKLNLFTLWPGFEELDAQIVGPGGQALEELNADHSELDIRQVQ